MRSLSLILILALSLISSSAFAASLNVAGGLLLGASGVIVDGISYDVEFLDGTCIELYGGCNDLADFTFQSEANAVLAAQALLDQVFLDGSAGPFDSVPELTVGCDFGISACKVLTPFYLDMSTPQVSTIQSRNEDPSMIEMDQVLLMTNLGNDANLVSEPELTYAVWSTPVPEPSTTLLMGFGLIGLSSAGHRLNS